MSTRITDRDGGDARNGGDRCDMNLVFVNPFIFRLCNECERERDLK